MRRKHGFLVVACVSLASLMPAPKAGALFGVGDIVLDPSNLAQAVTQVANQVQQLANDAIKIYNQGQQLYNQGLQIYNQYEQIQLAIQNLENVDFSSWSSAIRSINLLRSTYSTVVSRVNWVSGTVEGWYDTAYPEDHSALASASSLQPVLDHNTEKLDNSYDANRGSALQAAESVESMNERDGRVAGISDASDRAQGTKAAMQSNTQMVGEVLGELQGLHLSLLAIERREATAQADELDEERLAAAQREAFNADAQDPHVQFSATVPAR